jgi:hypothetical protein
LTEPLERLFATRASNLDQVSDKLEGPPRHRRNLHGRGRFRCDLVEPPVRLSISQRHGTSLAFCTRSMAAEFDATLQALRQKIDAFAKAALEC